MLVVLPPPVEATDSKPSVSAPAPVPALVPLAFDLKTISAVPKNKTIPDRPNQRPYNVMLDVNEPVTVGPFTVNKNGIGGEKGYVKYGAKPNGLGFKVGVSIKWQGPR